MTTASSFSLPFRQFVYPHHPWLNLGRTPNPQGAGKRRIRAGRAVLRRGAPHSSRRWSCSHHTRLRKSCIISVLERRRAWAGSRAPLHLCPAPAGTRVLDHVVRFRLEVSADAVSQGKPLGGRCRTWPTGLRKRRARTCSSTRTI